MSLVAERFTAAALSAFCFHRHAYLHYNVWAVGDVLLGAWIMAFSAKEEY